MKRFIAVAVVITSICGADVFAVSYPVAVTAKQKVRASVVGTGKTKEAARNDAKQKGYELAGTFTFQIVSESTTGGGASWTCSMVIEYEPK